MPVSYNIYNQICFAFWVLGYLWVRPDDSGNLQIYILVSKPGNDFTFYCNCFEENYQFSKQW